MVKNIKKVETTKKRAYKKKVDANIPRLLIDEKTPKKIKKEKIKKEPKNKKEKIQKIIKEKKVLNKKEPKNKKKIEKTKEEKVDDIKKILDLALMCDCTGSMSSWMERAKTTLHSIINNIKNNHENLQIRVSFVGYRDFGDAKHFEIKPFTEDVDSVKNFISGLVATGGNDTAEDVSGGLRQILDLNWIGDTRICFLICDAPAHGKAYHDINVMDNYTDKNPNGLIIEDLMKELNNKGIHFTGIKLLNICDKMFEVMKKSYDTEQMKLEVYNFDNFELKDKTFEEVSKKFIEVASFIISDKLKKKVENVKKWKGEIMIGDWFSFTNYLNVKNITFDKIQVTNSHNNIWDVSKDILEKMYSANHFEKTIAVTRTEIVEKLKLVHDKIYTVSFLKKIKK
jgi:hypothetical protein